MKTVILAGGYGTRLAEETEVRPKPMLPIGERPILWHIMKHYATHGFDEFCVALGYKGDMIKRYFLDYHTLGGSLTIDLAKGSTQVVGERRDAWRIHLVETGIDANTGGRLLWMKPYLQGERFMLTYGDGVSDIDLRALLRFHESHGKMATVTAVRPPSRFGGLVFEGDRVAEFTEKPQTGEGWISGGYMVLEPGVLERIARSDQSLERDVLEDLAVEGELFAYKHPGFWQCMDTKRDLTYLKSLWEAAAPPGRSGPMTSAAFWQDRPTLVTGATGLVGSWTVRQLLDLGADVVCARTRLVCRTPS